MVVIPSPRIMPKRLVLMPDIQVRRRLVEDEQTRRLRQRPSDHHALLFPARQRVERAIGQRRDAHTRKRRRDDLKILARISLEQSLVGPASHQHHLANRKRRFAQTFLQDDAHLAGDVVAARSQTPRPSTETRPLSGRITR